jgi:hypothetical protein
VACGCLEPAARSQRTEPVSAVAWGRAGKVSRASGFVSLWRAIRGIPLSAASLRSVLGTLVRMTSLCFPIGLARPLLPRAKEIPRTIAAIFQQWFLATRKGQAA